MDPYNNLYYFAFDDEDLNYLSIYPIERLEAIHLHDAHDTHHSFQEAKSAFHIHRPRHAFDRPMTPSTDRGSALRTPSLFHRHAAFSYRELHIRNLG